MDSDQQGREIDRMAEVAQRFLLRITRAGMRLKLTQDQAVLLCGVFARKCVDARVKSGVAQDKASMDMMYAFMKGMGMDVMIEKADETEAAALEAEIQRRKGTLQ